MGKIKEVLKKTPLREAWWKIKGVPPIKQIRDYLGDIHEDKLYYEWIPEIYKKAALRTDRKAAFHLYWFYSTNRSMNWKVRQSTRPRLVSRSSGRQARGMRAMVM